MKWNKRLVQLNDALASLVPSPNSALSFLEKSEIDFGLINFDGGPFSMWNNILHDVNVKNQVDILVDNMLKNFQNNPYLMAYKQDTLQDYTLGPDIKSLSWKGKVDQDIQEKISGAANTLLAICFLESGLKASRSVARVIIQRTDKVELGSGFLIGENIFITNHHVIPDTESAGIAELQFDYQLTLDATPAEHKSFQLDPESYFKTDVESDWTAVKIKGDANTKYKQLTMKDGAIKKGDFVAIIQHPGGRYKEIGIYHNIVTYEDDKVVQYLTDTEQGSSGSPVFNSNWEVIAVHHSAGISREPGLSQKMLRNEGVAIENIIKGLR